MTQQFKKGDRVKVEFEGEVTHSYVDGSLAVRTMEGYTYVPSKAGKHLLEPPVEPLAPGSVVRHSAGTVWVVQKEGVLAVGSGDSFPSGLTARTLAELVRDRPSKYTLLLHDGSATT